MEFILDLAVNSIEQVWLTLLHNWPYLLVSVVIAALLKLYVDIEKVAVFLKRNRSAGVVAATTVAVATPLCSCGTTAVVLGMMANMMPWAPIVAFMVASPLTSPEGLVYSAGIFGWPFALAFFISSILLGLFGGWTATVFEKRGWLANQTRFASPVPAACACSTPANQPAFTNRVYSLDVPVVSVIEPSDGCGCTRPVSTCGCGEPLAASESQQSFTDCACEQADCACEQAVCACEQTVTSCGCSQPVPACECKESFVSIDSVQPVSTCGCGSPEPVVAGSQAGAKATSERFIDFLKEMYSVGKRLLVMFVGFAFIGYFLNGLIPASWVTALFGSGNVYSVPLAATLGLPFYINSEASLPLIRTLMDAGMSQGAGLAFMIAGAGTSIGAIGGALTIARWRVVALVVGVLWVGAIASGYAYDLYLSLQLI
jgi:uncharacterized membrane protein YraQ (UPF0718 family)